MQVEHTLTPSGSLLPLHTADSCIFGILSILCKPTYYGGFKIRHNTFLGYDELTLLFFFLLLNYATGTIDHSKERILESSRRI